MFEAAVDLAISPDVEGERRSPAQRRADALVDLSQWFLDHFPAGSKRRRRADLDVVVNLDNVETGVGSLARERRWMWPRSSACCATPAYTG